MIRLVVMSEGSEQLQGNDRGERDADRQHDRRPRSGLLLFSADVHVEQQVADARAEVMK
jgi:hypothetical protein